MLMKDKFSKFINLQGKYLTSLLFVLFFAVGQMWGTLTAHTPGVYEKTTGEGGYGLTMVSYDPDGAGDSPAKNYEVYYFSWKSSKLYLAAGKSYVTDNTAYCLISNSGTSTTDGIDFGWGNVKCGSLSGSNTSPAAEWAVPASNSSTHYVSLTNSTSLTLKVSGYDQFSFAGRDNHASTAGKQFVVTIDGEAQTFTHSATDWTVYRFDLTTGEHTIVVTGNGTDANRLRCFSLRVPSCDDANATIIEDKAIYVNDELDLQFSSDNTNSVSYSITKGGSATSDASVTGGKFKATVAGTYVVTATQAKDASGHCAVEESVTITVNAKTPVSSVSISGDATAFIGIAKTLTATADQAVSEYKWEVNGVDQGVNAATFDFSAAAAGTYSVVCKARNSFNDPGEYISSSAHEIVVTKLCGELIRATRNGKNLDPVTGVVGGTAQKNTQDNGKLGQSGHYWKLVLASGNFMIGDVVTVNVSSAAGQGTLAITTDQAGANIVATAGGVGVAGDNELTITEAVGNTIWLSRDGTNNTWNGVVDAIYVTRSCAISDDCSIKSLTINGEAITPSEKVYSYEVASVSTLTQVAVAYTTHPLATGVPASGFNVTVPAAGDPANTQTITVTAEDGTHSDTYTVSVTKATAASDVVTLDDLGVTGYTLDPAFDAATLAYTITKAYGAEDPGTDKVTYTKTEEAQNVAVAYDSENHKLTVTVTAEDNTHTQDYVITINEAEAPKSLSRVLFSNGFDAFIDNTNHTVKAYYLAGTTAPTATTITAGAGTAGEYAEGKITVTGADASTVDYIVTLEAVTPNTTTVAEEAAAGEFAGDESWVKNGLLIYGDPAGYNATNKWYVIRRQLKSGDAADDQRVIAGWVRSYFFVGDTYKFIMTVSNNKPLKYAVDGGTPVEVNADALEITLTAGNHMIEIVSNQSSGDCRLSAPKLVEMPTLYDVTYSAGEGSVKSGETLPTQVATMEGGKFNLASGDALEKSGHLFAGWLCSADATIYNAGAEYTMTAAATTFTAQWEDVSKVAKIVETDAKFDNIANAFAAVADGQTIELIQNCSYGTAWNLNAGTVTLDLNGKDLTYTGAGRGVQVSDGAKLILEDGTATVAPTIDLTAPISRSSITYTSGTFDSKDGMCALAGSEIEINSGRYLATEGVALVMGQDATVTVNGGVLISRDNGVLMGNGTNSAAYQGYVINVHGGILLGEIVSANYASMVIYHPNTGTLNIDGGILVSTNGPAVVVRAGESHITGGTIIAQGSGAGWCGDNKSTIEAVGVAYDFKANYPGEDIEATISGTADVSGEAGAVKAIYVDQANPTAAEVDAVAISGGTFSSVLTNEVCAEGFVPAPEDPVTHKYTVQLAGVIRGASEQRADNVYYYTIDNNYAVIYASNGDGQLYTSNHISNSSSDVVSCGGDAVGHNCNQSKFILQFPVNVKEFTLYGANSTERTISTVYVNAEASKDIKIKNVGKLLTGTYSNTKDGKCQTLTAAFTGENVIPAYNYVWVTLSGTANIYRVVYTEAECTTPTVTVADQTAKENVAVTLTAEANALGATYQWYTCDDETGANPDIIIGETAKTLSVTKVGSDDQFYKVVVGCNCSDKTAEAVAKVSLYTAITTLADVTGDTEWDWSTITNDVDGAAITSDGKKVNGANGILANYLQGADLDKIEGNNGAYAIRSNSNKYYQGASLHMHTTVPGFLKINARNDGSGAMKLKVGNIEFALTGSFKDYELYVQAGDVTIENVPETAGKPMRVAKITFTVKETPDYTRTEMLGEGVLGTICLPNNVPAGAAFGATFYELQGRDYSNYGKLAFDEIVSGELEAGKPYVFLAHGDVINIYYGATHVDAPVNGDGMYGTFTAITLPNVDLGVENLNDIYYFAQRALWSCAGALDLTIAANRAYVKLSEIDDVPSSAPAAGRRRILLGVNGENAAQGIEDVQGDNVQSTKVLINGNLYILRGEKVFDATGRLVK